MTVCFALFLKKFKKKGEKRAKNILQYYCDLRLASILKDNLSFVSGKKKANSVS
jgi:hypothetical protein